ncbi:MAG: SIS domain-containing protein [Candidatus Krumholzibacteriota bacterium]|nr:SIS domain-containing protein [Candidatus Krumholzibacteriota bacterium]
MDDNYLKQVVLELDALRGILEEFPEEEKKKIVSMAEVMAGAISREKVVFTAGNGGSAADAMHIAGELVGRFRRKKIKGYKAISLTVNSSVVTALANDYSYDDVFSKQLESMGSEGDVLLLLSTSGNSPNAVKAVEMADTLGMVSLAFTGGDGGVLAKISKIALTVPDNDFARIQEVHMVAGHILCGLVEDMLVNGKNAR